jgi:hypothetical protein
MKKSNNLVELIKKNKTLFLLAAIIIVIFNKYIILMIALIIFAFLGIFTIKISRMVPHISAETVTASSILIGYLWGWQIGLAFGIIVGFAGYVNASQMNITTIICSLLMGLCGILGSLFHNLGYQFWVAFILAYVIRANLSFFLISMVNPNTFENILHSYVESVFNIVVTMQLLQVVYNVIVPLISM